MHSMQTSPSLASCTCTGDSSLPGVLDSDMKTAAASVTTTASTASTISTAATPASSRRVPSHNGGNGDDHPNRRSYDNGNGTSHPRHDHEVSETTRRRARGRPQNAASSRTSLRQAESKKAPRLREDEPGHPNGNNDSGRRRIRAAEKLELAEVAQLSSEEECEADRERQDGRIDGSRRRRRRYGGRPSGACEHRCSGRSHGNGDDSLENTQRSTSRSQILRPAPPGTSEKQECSATADMQRRQQQRHQHHQNFLERLFDSLNMEVAPDHSASLSSLGHVTGHGHSHDGHATTDPTRNRIRGMQSTSAAEHDNHGNYGQDDDENNHCGTAGESFIAEGMTAEEQEEEQVLEAMEIKSAKSFISHETIDFSFRDKFIEGDHLPETEGIPVVDDAMQSSIHLQRPHNHHDSHCIFERPKISPPRYRYHQQQQKQQQNSITDIDNTTNNTNTTTETAKYMKQKAKSTTSRPLQKELSTKRFSTESVISTDNQHHENDDQDSLECFGGESDTHVDDYGRLVETALAHRSSMLSEASHEDHDDDDNDGDDPDPRDLKRNHARKNSDGNALADVSDENVAHVLSSISKVGTEQRAEKHARTIIRDEDTRKAARAAEPKSLGTTEEETPVAEAVMAAGKTSATETPQSHSSTKTLTKKYQSFPKSKPYKDSASATTDDSESKSYSKSQRKGNTKSSSFKLPSQSASHSKAKSKNSLVPHGRKRSNSTGQKINNNSSVKCETPSVLLDLIIEFQRVNPPILEDDELINNEDHVHGDDDGHNIRKEQRRQQRREHPQRHRRQQEAHDDVCNAGKHRDLDDLRHRRSRRRHDTVSNSVIKRKHTTTNNNNNNNNNEGRVNDREKEKEKLRNSLRRSIRKSSTNNTTDNDHQPRSCRSRRCSNQNENDLRTHTTASHRKSTRRREGDDYGDIILEEQEERGTKSHQHQHQQKQENQQRPKKKGHTPPVQVIYAHETPSAEKFSLSEDQMMEFCQAGANVDAAKRRESSDRLASQKRLSSKSHIADIATTEDDCGASRKKEKAKAKNLTCKNVSVSGGKANTDADPEPRGVHCEDASVISDERNNIDVCSLQSESESEREGDRVEGESGHVSLGLKQDRDLDLPTKVRDKNPFAENDSRGDSKRATQQPASSEKSPPMDLTELRKMKMMEQMMQAKKQFDEMRQKQLSFTRSESSAKDSKGRTHRRASLGSLRKKSQVHPSPQSQESEKSTERGVDPSFDEKNGYVSSSDSSSDSDSNNSRDRSIEIISTSDSCGDDSIDINNSDDSSIDDFNASSDDFSDSCDLEAEDISDIYAPLSIPIPAEIPNILFDASEESFMDSEMDMGLCHSSTLTPEASADVTIIPSSMSVLTNSTREKSETKNESYRMLIDESIDDSSTSSCSSYDGSNPSNYTCEVNDGSQFFDSSARDMSIGRSSAGLSGPDPTLDVLNSIVDDQSEGIDEFMASKVNLNDDGDDDNIQDSTETHSRGSKLSALHETDGEDSDAETDIASSNFESISDSDKSRMRSNSRASTDSASRKSGNSQRKSLKKSKILSTIKAAATSAIHHKDIHESAEKNVNSQCSNEGKMSAARKSILTKSSRKNSSSLKLVASPDHHLDNGQSMKQIEDELRSKHPEPSAAIQKLRARLRAHRTKQAENLTTLSKSLPTKLTEAEVSPARQVVHGKNGQTMCQRDDSQRRCKSLSGSANTAHFAEINEIINDALQEKEKKSPFFIPADLAREVDANSLRTESSEESDDPASTFLHSIEKRQRDLVMREGSRLKPERRPIASPISQSVTSPSLNLSSGHMLSASMCPATLSGERGSFPKFQTESSSLLHQNTRGSRVGRHSGQACLEENHPYSPDNRFNRAHFQSYNNRRHTSEEHESITDRYGQARRRHRSKSYLHHHGPSHWPSYSHEEQARHSYHFEDQCYNGLQFASDELDSSVNSDRSIRHEGGSGLVSWDELGDAINLGLYKSISEVNTAVIEMQALECDSLGSSGRNIHASNMSHHETPANVPAERVCAGNNENEFKTNPDEPWECPVCTFINENGLHLVCAVCNSPRFSSEM